VQRLQGGPRKLTYVTEVLNMEQDQIVMQDIFLFKQQGIDENGKAYGHFEATGVRPSFMSRLEGAGVKLPSNLFAARAMGK
ncbi:MAG: CpaF family protein, partial [Planctomycetes bacterium]|nr:CpaF family protein [Planctomycetota bacterium]